MNKINGLEILTRDTVEVLEIDLTGTCNLNCPLCARNFEPMQDKKHFNARDINEIIKQLDTFPNLKECSIGGHISEPTLYKDLFILLDYLNKRNIKKEFYTNSDLHNNSYWIELSKHFLPSDKVYFTVCGSTQELHEKYRKGSKLTRVLKRALLFKKHCPYDIAYLEHIKFEYNIEDFEKNMHKILKRFNNHYLIDSLQYNNRFNVLPEDSDIQMRPELRKKYLAIMNSLKEKKKDDIILCKSLQDKFIDIDQDGNIHPCFLHRMYKPGKWDFDYSKILDNQYDFCFECKAKVIKRLEMFNMERIG
jgi:MoaA/NifB/PqqE/SkfB family radical SAM enzyme